MNDTALCHEMIDSECAVVSAVLIEIFVRCTAVSSGSEEVDVAVLHS